MLHASIDRHTAKQRCEQENLLPRGYNTDVYCTLVFREDYCLITARNINEDVNNDLFVVIDQRVHFKNTQTQKRVAEVLSRVAGITHDDTFALLVFSQPRSDRLPLVLRILAQVHPSHGVIGVLTVMDLEKRHHLPETLLRATFGLTRAEAALASTLAEGETLQEIAMRTGVRMPTLRSQLSCILAKTGTARQAQLICLLGKMLVLGAGEASWE